MYDSYAVTQHCSIALSTELYFVKVEGRSIIVKTTISHYMVFRWIKVKIDQELDLKKSIFILLIQKGLFCEDFGMGL